MASPPLDEQGTPEKIEEGALYGRMYHLSPKYVSYLDEVKFLEEFGMVSGGIEQPEDCLEKVETSAGEVEFGPNSEGWSNTDPASPINACLAADGDGTHVGIVNRVNYILSVASTTDSQHLETSYNDFEEEMVKTFASTIFPNARIDTFFGREGRMDATFAPEDLPATIQMKADPNTYLSEVGWFALKFLANVFTGGMASEAVQALLTVPDVISCLQTTFDIGEGDVEGFSLLDAINYVSSTCVQVIAEAVGYQPSFWDYLGRLFGVVAEGVAGGLQTIMTAAEGIRMQFIGMLTVEVSPVMPECPTDADFEKAAADIIMGPAYEGHEGYWDSREIIGSSVVDDDRNRCERYWAGSLVDVDFQDPGDIQRSISVMTLLYWQDGEWGRAVHPDYCADDMPGWVLGYMSCL